MGLGAVALQFTDFVFFFWKLLIRRFRNREPLREPLRDPLKTHKRHLEIACNPMSVFKIALT